MNKIKDFFNRININKEIKNKSTKVLGIKLLNKDKLIILERKNVFIYDLSKEKL